jgi:K+/H+ antiporter YhaU regulatory subunit KhtT
VGQGVGDLEQRGRGAFFIIQLDRKSGQTITRPGAEVKIEPGDGVLIVARGQLAAVTAIFQSPPERVRAGRTRF